MRPIPGDVFFEDQVVIFHPEQFVARVSQHIAGGLVRLHVISLRVRHHDAVGRLIDQRAVFLLAFSQFLFRLFLVRHVRNHTHHLSRGPGRLRDDERPVFQPPNLSVWLDDPVIAPAVLNLLCPDHLFEVRRDPFPVIRMHRLHPRHCVFVHFFDGTTENLLIRRADVDRLCFFEIEYVEHIPDRLRESAKSLFRFNETVFHLLLFGDVAPKDRRPDNPPAVKDRTRGD